MRLCQQQVDDFERNGFVVVDRAFGPEEVEAFREGFRRDCEVPGEHRVMETDGSTVRAVYASHLRDPLFAGMVRSPQLLEPANQLLGCDVYLYQFKINAKTQFSGSGWAWHQDFEAWKAADGLSSPRLLNAAIFLDDIDEFNGPLIFLPGTHRRGLLKNGDGSEADGRHLDPNDIAIAADTMSVLVGECGMTSVKGPAGTVAFFGPEIVHGSAQNVSPHPRALAILTYNDVANPPPGDRPRRPEYLVGRDVDPLRTERHLHPLGR